MINGEIVVATLKEILKRTDTSSPSDVKLREVTDKAHRRMLCGGEFPSQLVISSLLGTLKGKGRFPRLLETSLACLQHLFHARMFDPLRRLSGDAVLPALSAVGPSSSTASSQSLLQQFVRHSRSASSPIASCNNDVPPVQTFGSILVDCLIDVVHTQDVAVQMKAIEVLQVCVQHKQSFGDMGSGISKVESSSTAHGDLLKAEDDQELFSDPFMLFGSQLMGVTDSLFRLAANAAPQSVLQINSYGLLTMLVRRTVRQFVTAAISQNIPSTSSSRSGLMIRGVVVKDFSTDVPPNGPYVPLEIISASSSADDTRVPDARFLLFTSPRTPTLPPVATRSEIGGCPLPVRDLVTAIKYACFLASKAIPQSSVDDNSEAARSRVQGLQILYVMLEELPVANNEQEHPCAPWLEALIRSCKYEMLKAIARNVATITPISFFTTAIDVLCMVLQKCFFHLQGELLALLNIVVFPLTQSQFSNISQKMSVLSLLRTILSKPHLVVALFINCDCNPAFDAANKFGGLFESIVDAATELPYLNFRQADWFSEDHQNLLQCESLRVIHDFVLGMKRWLYEDPKDYAQKEDDTVIQSMSKNYSQTGGGGGGDPAGGGAHLASELYLDNWSSSSSGDDSELDCSEANVGNSDDESSCTQLSTDDDLKGHHQESQQHRYGVEEIGSPHKLSGSTIMASTTPSPAATVVKKYVFHGPRAGKGKKRCISYHWKHIHLLLRNKRILQEAAARTNSNWRRGMAYLIEQRAIPEENSLLHFAWFLREAPSISKGALCAIFERVHKDAECAQLLRHYLATFDYRGVPVDVALRDTTCEFMSWDRMQFESQVWEKIQQLFGTEYAAQNKDFISERDADAMAGVLLFVHTSFHNTNAQSHKVTLPQFIRDGGACLERPLPDADMKDMFERISTRKWALDEYQRTPRQQDLLEGRVWKQCQPQALGKDTDAKSSGRRESCIAEASEDGSKHVDPMATSSPANLALDQSTISGAVSSGVFALDSTSNSSSLVTAAEAVIPSPVTGKVKSLDEEGQGRTTDRLLESRFDCYTDNPDRIKHKQEHEQLYVRVAHQHLVKLEAEHRQLVCHTHAQRQQPYLIPHYAQHIRPIFLTFYAHVVSVCYLMLRIQKHEPILRLVLDVYQNLHDIAAVFCINVNQLETAVSKKIQKCLRQDNAVKFSVKEIRSSITAFLMNQL